MPVQHTTYVPYTVHHEVLQQIPVVNYYYDALGRVTQARNTNNTNTQYTYTSGGLVKTIANYTGTTLSSSFAYTYYPNGNVATETTNTGKVTTYIYDDLGRLTSEAITGTNNNSTLTYTYDERGNRLTQSRGASTVTYTYDLNNRLTSDTTSGVVSIYTYDANGNTLTIYSGGNFAGGYTYDLFNRQKTYTPDGAVFTTTTYRPDGMRHSIGNTKHIWDNGNIVGDVTVSTYKQYFRALNLIYSLIGTTKQYYRYNAHGDVISLTNSSGTVTKTYTYNAFGEEQNIDNIDANPFRYCGEYYDKVSGTLYLRARNYNASIGRFTQQDDWEYIDCSNPLTTNLYTYCWNNPVNAHDPSGHFGLLAAIIGGALIGGVISAAVSAVSQVVTTGAVNWGVVGVNFVSGAISGALAATPIGLAASVGINAALGGATYVAEQAVKGEEIELSGVITETVVGGITGLIGGKGTNTKEIGHSLDLIDGKIARELRRENTKAATKKITTELSRKAALETDLAVAGFRYVAGEIIGEAINDPIEQLADDIFSNEKTVIEESSGSAEPTNEIDTTVTTNNNASNNENLLKPDQIKPEKNKFKIQALLY